MTHPGRGNRIPDGGSAKQAQEPHATRRLHSCCECRRPRLPPPSVENEPSSELVVQVQLQPFVVELRPDVLVQRVHEVLRVQPPVLDRHVAESKDPSLRVGLAVAKVRVDELTEQRILVDALVGGSELPVRSLLALPIRKPTLYVC